MAVAVFEFRATNLFKATSLTEVEVWTTPYIVLLCVLVVCPHAGSMYTLFDASPACTVCSLWSPLSKCASFAATNSLYVTKFVGDKVSNACNVVILSFYCYCNKWRYMCCDFFLMLKLNVDMFTKCLVSDSDTFLTVQDAVGKAKSIITPSLY